MSGATFTRNRSLVAAGGLLLLAAVLWPGWRTEALMEDAPESGHSEAFLERGGVSADEETVRGRHLRADDGREERDRLEVEAFAAKYRAHAGKINAGPDSAFPRELLQEAVLTLSARQLRQLVRTIGKDASLPVQARSLMVSQTMEAWAKTPDSRESDRKREMFEVLFELVPDLESEEIIPGMGCDTAPFWHLISEENAGDVADFVSSRWTGWRNVPQIRQFLLNQTRDPVQRAMIEALPGK